MKRLFILLCLAAMAGSAWGEDLNGGPLVANDTENIQGKVEVVHNEENPSTVHKGSFWTINPETDKVTLKHPLSKSVYKRRGHVYLSDGRVCKGCTIYKNTDMPEELGLVVDSHGKWYRSHGFRLVGVDEHPYARAYAMGAAMAAQQYSAQIQQQNYVNQMKPARNWNCNSFGNSTSCYGY